MSNGRGYREPIATYDQALWRFIGLYPDLVDLVEYDDELPHAAQIICDVFWVTDAQFRADVKKRCLELVGGFQRPMPRARSTAKRRAH